MISRRRFLGALFGAPAICKAANLMPLARPQRFVRNAGGLLVRNNSLVIPSTFTFEEWLDDGRVLFFHGVRVVGIEVNCSPGKMMQVRYDMRGNGGVTGSITTDRIIPEFNDAFYNAMPLEVTQ